MEFRHGGLAIDIPGDWSDQSQLLFVAPRDEAPMPTAHSVQRPTEAVSIQLIAADDLDARELLERQAERLGDVDAGFEVVDQGEFSCGLGAGWQLTQRLDIGDAPVQQLSVACVSGAVAVVATASAAAARFDQVETQLRAVLESLRVAGRK